MIQCEVQHKYLSRFVATFFAENQRTAKPYKINFKRAASIIVSVIYLKTGYKPEMEDIYMVFKSLCYAFNGAGFAPDEVFPSCHNAYVNVDSARLENLTTLVKHLNAQALNEANARIRELNLQIDIFNKLHAVSVKAA